LTITKRPKKSTPAAAEAFIGQAPDAGATAPTEVTEAGPRRVRKGNKVQITLTISEALLDRVDARATELGQSRAGFINLAVSQVLETGFQLGPKR
jgi:hypothetical protein